jgi:hypothetical protein
MEIPWHEWIAGGRRSGSVVAFPDRWPLAQLLPTGEARFQHRKESKHELAIMHQVTWRVRIPLVVSDKQGSIKCLKAAVTVAREIRVEPP